MSFNLSSKIVESGLDTHLRGFSFNDVREFIRLLKEEAHEYPFLSATAIYNSIDELAGEELVDE